MPSLARGTIAVLRSVAGTAALLLAASVVIFALIRSAPGDPVDVQLGEAGGVALTEADEERIRAARYAELGLDRPLAVQYLNWLSRMLSGDWGVSYMTGQPVLDEVAYRLPASLAIALPGLVIAVVIGIGLALIAARRPGSATDHGVRIVTLFMIAVPSFLLGTVALQVVTRVGDYQIAGGVDPGRIWLPALVLGLSISPTMSRVMRASLIQEQGRLYAVAAQARGIGPTKRMLRHVLRPASVPVLTLCGLAFASLITGSIITEAIFTWPGLGRYAVDAIAAQDYPVIQAYVLLATLIVVVINRLIDVVQRLVDPRGDRRAEAVA